ncbi:hypothetical protein THAOC_29134, partial [Thalassiosira oceanica]
RKRALGLATAPLVKADSQRRRSTVAVVKASSLGVDGRVIRDPGPDIGNPHCNLAIQEECIRLDAALPTYEGGGKGKEMGATYISYATYMSPMFTGGGKGKEVGAYLRIAHAHKSEGEQGKTKLLARVCSTIQKDIAGLAVVIGFAISKGFASADLVDNAFASIDTVVPLEPQGQCARSHASGLAFHTHRQCESTLGTNVLPHFLADALLKMLES